jgi:hypothetical protein
MNKFFNRRKTEACSSTKNQDLNVYKVDGKHNEKNYLDCPLPIKDYQDKIQSRKLSKQMMQSH